MYNYSPNGNQGTNQQNNRRNPFIDIRNQQNQINGGNNSNPSGFTHPQNSFTNQVNYTQRLQPFYSEPQPSAYIPSQINNQQNISQTYPQNSTFIPPSTPIQPFSSVPTNTSQINSPQQPLFNQTTVPISFNSTQQQLSPSQPQYQPPPPSQPQYQPPPPSQPQYQPPPPSQPQYQPPPPSQPQYQHPPPPQLQYQPPPPSPPQFQPPPASQPQYQPPPPPQPQYQPPPPPQLQYQPPPPSPPQFQPPPPSQPQYQPPPPSQPQYQPPPPPQPPPQPTQVLYQMQPQYQQQQSYGTQVLTQPQPQPFVTVPINSIPIPYTTCNMPLYEQSIPPKSQARIICSTLDMFTDYISRTGEEELISLLEKKKIKKKMANVIQKIQEIFSRIKSQKFYKILKKFAKKYKRNKKEIENDIKTVMDKYNDFKELYDYIKDLPSEFDYEGDSSDDDSSSSSDDGDDKSDSDKEKTKRKKHSSVPTSPVNLSSTTNSIYDTPEDIFTNTSFRRSISPPPSLKRSYTPPPSHSFSSSSPPPPPEPRTNRCESKPVKKEEPTEDCAICMSDVPLSQIFSCPCKEHHKFCVECGRRGFNNDLKERKLPTCAMQCGYQYTIKDVEKMFEDTMGLQFTLQAFSDLHDEVFLRNKMVECPVEGCHGEGYIDDADVTEAVECPKCGEFFCPRCQLISHPSFECDSIRRFQQQWYEWNISGRDERRRQKGTVERLTNEARQKDAKRKEEIRKRLTELQNDEEFKKQNCRLCPRCKIPIQKTGGCRDMICGQDYHGGNGQPGCGHHFDYYDEGLPYVPTIENHMQNEDFFKNIPKIDNDTDHEYACSNCNKRIHGIRFGCLHVVGYYLCEECEADENIRKNHHPHGDEHIFRIITSPDDF